MRNYLMRWSTFCVSFAILVTACKLLEDGQPSMKTVMQKGFKGDNSLLKRIIEGKATQQEKNQFVAYVETLPGFTPKKGSGWSKKATAVVHAAKAVRDGAGDLVEALTGSDPLMADTFEACAELENPGADADRDGLTDCEEMLLGTDLAMVDTDGDALPDGMELVRFRQWIR